MKTEYNELGLDEVVLENCHFHLERMDDKTFWIGISNKNGYHHINLYIEKGKLIAKINEA